MVGPYVDEEVAWVDREARGAALLRRMSRWATPIRQAYIDYFGPGLPARLTTSAGRPRRRGKHRWYMTSRLLTINDIYSFDPNVVVDFDEFEDVVGRQLPPARGGTRIRRLAGSAHVADDDLAEQLPVSMRARAPRRGHPANALCFQTG